MEREGLERREGAGEGKSLELKGFRLGVGQLARSTTQVHENGDRGDGRGHEDIGLV